VRQPRDGEDVTVGGHGGEGLLGPLQGLFGPDPGMLRESVDPLIWQR
jgi:hypothetical protein